METLNLDVRVIEPRFKHPTIFDTFDSLNKGEAFVIINDHDPKPLYYQLLAERPNQFNWEYLQNGPEEWRVKIEKPLAQTKSEGKTMGKIATEDYRKALVFKKFGLDFCCGGKRTLEQAAKEKGIDAEPVQKELDALDQKTDTGFQDYTKWGISDLASHILERHHGYVKERTPEIKSILNKVVSVHSDAHPELLEVLQNFTWLDQDLADHMLKEESILFPYMQELDQSRKVPENAAIQSIINTMEEEHEAAGEYLENLRKITNDYNVPKGACGSYRLLYSLLNEYEDDLHLHVHLENNILFPKAAKLEEQLLK